MTNGEMGLPEMGRSLERIEKNLADLASVVGEEQRTQRHRINNIDTIIAGQSVRFEKIDEKFVYVGERIGTAEKDIQEIQEENRSRSKAQIAFLLGLITEGALLIVALVLAANQ